MIMHPIIKAGVLLLVFTAISIFLVALTQQSNVERIKYNEDQLLIKQLGELVQDYDNDIVQQKYTLKVELHGVDQILNIYPAKKQGRVFAFLVEHTYPKGYSGNIRLLTGIDNQGKLLGVRVISHKETPGLGDKIESRKSDWIKRFSGLSLSDPKRDYWKVKSDGGVFDAFTGATITPRAIVSATYQLLEFFNKQGLQNNK